MHIHELKYKFYSTNSHNYNWRLCLMIQFNERCLFSCQIHQLNQVQSNQRNMMQIDIVIKRIACFFFPFLWEKSNDFTMFESQCTSFYQILFNVYKF